MAERPLIEGLVRQVRFFKTGNNHRVSHRTRRITAVPQQPVTACQACTSRDQGRSRRLDHTSWLGPGTGWV